MAPTQQEPSREEQRSRVLAWLRDFFMGPKGAPKTLRAGLLAMDRTRLAAERTMMAWIRTALAMISFGFTIYKFFQIEEAGKHLRTGSIIGSRGFGALMIGLGLFALFLAAVQHRRELQTLRAAGLHVPPSMAALVGALVSVLGILGLLAVVFQK